MADGGVVVLDGSHIRNALPNLERRLEARHLDEKITAPEFLALAEAEASSILFDLDLSENLRALVLERPQLTDIGSLQFDRETVLRKLHDYLLALADELKDDPLIVSILDASVDEDHSGQLEQNEFQALVKGILETLAEQLAANPIFHDLEVAD